MKKIIRSRADLLTAVLFALATALLIGGAVGAARAVPTAESEYYSGGVEMFDIGVTLLENGNVVSSRTYSPNSRYVWDETKSALLGSLVDEGEDFHIGQTYTEKLAVQNSGRIDEFVRVTIYRYWLDKSGKKLTGLAPDMIDLNLLSGSDWVEDKDASSAERTVLYYTGTLTPGATTPAFSDTLTVSDRLPYLVHQSETDSVITTTYDYGGVTFQVEVEVDAVQTHNAEDAIRSAWGRDVSVSGGALKLK